MELTKDVFVAMPCLSEIKVETVASLLSFASQPVYSVAFQFIKDTVIHRARNKFIYEAAKQNADYILFIDSDMIFPGLGLHRLIQSKKDIIGGLYRARTAPNDYVIKEIKNGEIDDWDGEIPKNVFEVDAIGTGFLLINMDVFKKMDPPFFSYGKREEFGLKPKSFPDDDLGEDVTFCLRAKKAGFKIYCDPTFPVDHVGQRIFKQ